MSKQSITAMVVGVLGETEVINIAPGQFQQEFRKHCEARYFDHLQLAQDLDVWVDDEGLLMDPVVVNWPLTDMRNDFWRDSGIEIPPDWPPLAGKALLTGGADDEGETLSLPQEMIEQLELFFANWRSRLDSV